MRVIKVTKAQPYSQLSTHCGMVPGTCVGSMTCRGCAHFDGYDEGKAQFVLCDHPEQTLGSHVYEVNHV